MSSSQPPRIDSSDGRLRLALAHDYLLVLRGAERVVAAMADLYREAPIYTLLYDERGTHRRFASHAITTSPLQRIGMRQDGFRRLLPLYPWAVGRLHVEPVDVLLSSSSAFAHGVRKPPGAVHLCYCHTPFRYAWYEQQRALSEMPPPLRAPLAATLAAIRRWDRAAATRVDRYLSNSKLTQERVRRFFGRESVVVHPPVETHRFAPGTPGERLLLVSEIVRHKRLGVALEAARLAGTPIDVAGSGPDLEALRAAYPHARFLGRVGDDELTQLYARARAVVVPSKEEFGIAAVEAQASGRPVIAAAAGGALETVIDGRTGVLVPLDDVSAFARAMREIDSLPFEPAVAARHAREFSVEAFQRRLDTEVRRTLEGTPDRSPAQSSLS